MGRMKLPPATWPHAAEKAAADARTSETFVVVRPIARTLATLTPPTMSIPDTNLIDLTRIKPNSRGQIWGSWVPPKHPTQWEAARRSRSTCAQQQSCHHCRGTPHARTSQTRSFNSWLWASTPAEGARSRHQSLLFTACRDAPSPRFHPSAGGTRSLGSRTWQTPFSGSGSRKNTRWPPPLSTSGIDGPLPGSAPHGAEMDGSWRTVGSRSTRSEGHAR
jgi:hypothetical protein